MTDFNADDWQPKPYNIAERLRAAREAAKLQQKQVAAELGWDPAKLSKTESGARTPNADDIKAWARVTSMSDSDRDDALQELTRFKSSERSWRERMRHGRRKVQLEYNRLYRDSARFRMLQVAWVPGILQTPDYARQIFTDLDEFHPEKPRDIEADVQSRMVRREYLTDLSKDFKFIITEGVLRDLIVDPPVMRAQIQRLLDVMDLSNVELRILPYGRRRHTAAQAAFVLYDDLAVTEDWAGDRPFHGADAQRFAMAMDRLWVEAIVEDEARDLLRAVRDGLPRA